jgi:hypothetical protein
MQVISTIVAAVYLLSLYMMTSKIIKDDVDKGPASGFFAKYVLPRGEYKLFLLKGLMTIAIIIGTQLDLGLGNKELLKLINPFHLLFVFREELAFALPIILILDFIKSYRDQVTELITNKAHDTGKSHFEEYRKNLNRKHTFKELLLYIPIGLIALCFGSGHLYQGVFAIPVTMLMLGISVKISRKYGLMTSMILHVVYDLAIYASLLLG